MCVWILTVWIQLHFVYFVVSMDLKNETIKDKNTIKSNSECKNGSHVKTEASIRQQFHHLKPNGKNFEKLLKVSDIDLFNKNSDIVKNIAKVNLKNDLFLNITVPRNQSANLTFATKFSFAILKTNQDDLKNTPYRRNNNLIHALNLFLYNKSHSQLSITPDTIYKDIKHVSLIKENKQNTTEKDDIESNLRSTSKGTKTKEEEEFEGNEYVISKTDHESIRAMNPKIEKYRLGSLRFSSEVNIYNVETNANLGHYTTVTFDSHEDFTSKKFVFKQIDNVDSMDYNFPDEAFKTRDTKSIDYFLTSTSIVHLNTKTAKATTENPFRKELQQERIMMKMGPFTFFLYKLMELLAEKRPSRVAKDITDQFLNVSLQLYNERKNLFEFGQPFNRGVVEFFTNIRTYEADTLQRMASIFHRALPKRWELFHALVNVLYERIDNLYLQSEVEKMYSVLEDLKNYAPFNNSTQLTRRILVDAIVNPFTREGPTQRRMEMLARLNAYVSFAFYDAHYLDVPGFDEETAPPRVTMNSGITPSFAPTTRSLDRIYTKGLETASATSLMPKENLIGRTKTKHKNAQESNILINEEDILYKNLNKGAQVQGKSRFNNDDILSSYKKYHKKHKPPKYNYSDSNLSNSQDIKYESEVSTTNNSKKTIKKSKLKSFKQKLPLSSNDAKKIHRNENFNSEDNSFERNYDHLEFVAKVIPKSLTTGKRLKTTMNIINEKKSLSEPINLGKIWKDVLKAGKARDINMNDKKGLLKEQTGKPGSVSSLTFDNIVSASKEKNVLRNKILHNDETNIPINNSSVSQDKTKTTESFLNILLKLDELLNSGDGGVIDEILNSDSRLKDSTFKKIEKENELFLEKEATAKFAPDKPETFTTKEHVETQKNTVRSRDREHAKVLKTNINLTKQKYHTRHTKKKHRIEQYTRELPRSSKDYHIKYPLTEQYNDNIYYTPLRKKDKHTVKTTIKTTKHYTMKKPAHREKADHKNEKSVNVTGKYYTQREYYPQTQMNYVDAQQSKEIIYRHLYTKPKPKSKKKLITLNPARECTKDYVIKNAIGDSKEDYPTTNLLGQLTKYFVTEIPKKDIRKNREKLTPLKEFKKDNTSKNSADETKYYTKHHFTKNKIIKVRKGHISKKPSLGVSKYDLYVSHTSKPVLRTTDKNIKEIYDNIKNHPYTIKDIRVNTKYVDKYEPGKQNKQRINGHKTNELIKRDTYDDYNSLSDNLTKPLHVNEISSIEDASTNIEKASLKYRPAERIGDNIQRQKKEKRKGRKKKHFKYRPHERLIGKSKRVKKKHKKTKLNIGKSLESSSYVDHVKKTDENEMVNLDNSAVWNPTYSMEQTVKQNSVDDYYIVDGGGNHKTIFKDDDKTYELKKSKKSLSKIGKNETLLNYWNIHRYGGNSVSSKKGNTKYSASSYNEKSDDYNVRKQNNNNYTPKTVKNNLGQRDRDKENTNTETNNSTELTDLFEAFSDIDEFLDQNLVKAVSKRNKENNEDDFDAPINEYTLKPIYKSNTINVVFTTGGIFDELKQLKNRLFNQNFRRNMNRKKQITFNELFLKNRGNLKKILEESSYSDDEKDLKAKLQDALLHGDDKEFNLRLRA